jgi:hypothetical protein
VKRFAHSLSPVDSISTIDEQLQHSDGTVEDGEMVWVQSQRCLYVYRLGTSLTPDGINVVATAFAPGLWVRLLDTGDQSWQTQLTWFIDPANPAASDENTGEDAAHPLLTGAEFDRRFGNKQHPFGNYQIYVLSDIPYGDYLRISGVFVSGASVVVHGSATPGEGQVVLYTSVAGVTAHTVAVPAANTRPTISDPAVPTGTWTGADLLSLSSPANRRVRLTSGANVGAIGFASKEPIAGTVDTSFFGIIPPNALAGTSTDLPTLITPAVNDQFVVEQLTRIYDLRLEASEDASTQTTVYVESIDLAFLTCAGTQYAAFYGCTNVPTEIDTPGSIVCSTSHIAGGVLRVAETYLWACHMTSGISIRQGGLVTFDGHTIGQGSGLGDALEGGIAVIGSAAAFDSPYVLKVFQNGYGLLKDQSTGAGNIFWGDNNTGAALIIGSGCRVQQTGGTYVSTGTGGDFTLGGSGSARAWIEASATWTASGTCTWTHLADTPVGANKFAGSCHNVQEDAHIVLEA